jgi:transcriptional antiterminator
MNETEIAYELNVNQSTISRDVKALKELLSEFRMYLAISLSVNLMAPTTSTSIS